jgi:hypothetical protein
MLMEVGHLEPKQMIRIRGGLHIYKQAFNCFRWLPFGNTTQVELQCFVLDPNDIESLQLMHLQQQSMVLGKTNKFVIITTKKDTRTCESKF